MKVALLISGYLRSFEINLENIREKILSKFDEVDVYLHVTENEANEDRYLNFNLEDSILKIKNFLNPKCCLIEKNIFFSENHRKNSLYNQWIKFFKLNELKKTNEKTSGSYDLIIKMRPDLSLNSDINFENLLRKNTVFIPKDSKIDKKKLTNLYDKFLTDTFAFGDSNSMDIYFDIFNNLETLTNEYGFTPETILYSYLKNKIEIFEIDIDYLIVLSNCNVFAICGDSASGKSTLGNLLKKYFSSSFLLECDRYHKWERHDEKWSKYTHLNPEANYLTKMNQDIFDLKIGKNVYQVDYDHNTGKFTQKQKLKKAENLIVCGLHSLYKSNKNLYDLKIFMDTDENLKIKWKLARDTEKRGYTKEDVLNQIENRKEDFEKFILPQKLNSNVIIKFSEDVSERLILKITISKIFCCDHIISTLQKNLSSFKCETNDSEYFFNFNEYTNSKIFNSLPYRTYDYYDYIIYIILNLKKK